MCRKNQMVSLLLMAFGAGMLTGCCFTSTAVQVLLGAAALGSGICVLRCR